jgi:tetratricopeptide (TPR) repeat protein
LAFVLERTGHRLDARAAAKRAVTLEPENWRHYFRLAYVSWGEERLGAAHRTLALLPGFPLAHWLAATVHVARQALDEAERELVAGLQPAPQTSGSKFSAVALHWLLGLILLDRGDEAGALRELERELALENSGQLYARECAANTWYGIGAIKLRQGQWADARAAFECAERHVAAHPMAHVGRAAVDWLDGGTAPAAVPWRVNRPVAPVDAAVCEAALLALSDSHEAAARAVADALATAPPGNAAWLLPVEPLLHVRARPDVWAEVLAFLQNRAA